jgi:hypothetical protein
MLNEPKRGVPDDFKLALKMESVRSDERGSLTLLAGMMVFLVTIFAIIAFDTNKAIYNRIVAQNAVDAAADSAALWQARGCNLEQMLNNLHYDVDIAACATEGVATAGCVASAVFDVLQYVPFCEWAAGALQASCIVCDMLPVVDKLQHFFYDLIMPLQEGIADVTPFLAFGYADANAYGCGANNVFVSAVQTAFEYLSDGVSFIPGGGDISSSINSASSSVSGVINSTLGQIPIYAMPLNPQNLSLDVHTNDNNGSPPLYWPNVVPEIGNGIGEVACDGDVAVEYAVVQDSMGYSADGDNARNGSDNYKPQWGWNDQYYKGNPGYMTWVAGVTNAPEILGLGNLVWLNDYDQNTPNSMYWGSATTNGSAVIPVQIPSYIAIASCQVEGDTVICNGTADAVPVLIPVLFPRGSTNYTKGSSLPFPFTIYH